MNVRKAGPASANIAVSASVGCLTKPKRRSCVASSAYGVPGACAIKWAWRCARYTGSCCCQSARRSAIPARTDSGVYAKPSDPTRCEAPTPSTMEANASCGTPATAHARGENTADMCKNLEADTRMPLGSTIDACRMACAGKGRASGQPTGSIAAAACCIAALVACGCNSRTDRRGPIAGVTVAAVEARRAVRTRATCA